MKINASPHSYGRKSTRQARQTREVIDSVAARPLEGLSLAERARAQVLGGRVYEKVNAEKMKEGVTRNLREIGTHLTSGQDQSGTDYRYSSVLNLSQISAAVGLPRTQVGTRATGESDVPRSEITFFHPLRTQTQDSQDNFPGPDHEQVPIIDHPSFTLLGDEVLLDLGDSGELVRKKRPFDELSQEQQMRAYLVVADVAETMARAAADGSLAIVAGQAEFAA